ncbi:MAG: ferredoxin reductase family protein [Gemmatimonadota bacterium]|nr:MAG: ferredoxin reductase family protein [Gemmatimonadota bacterium]
MKKSILLAIMSLCLALPFLIWFRTISWGMPYGLYLYDAGRLLGLVGFILILFQYVFSSKLRIIEKGIGLDVLFSIHRKCGALGLTFVFIHPVLLFLSGVVLGYTPLFPPLKVLGAITLLFLIVAAATAMLQGMLGLKYETWIVIHRVSYIVFALGFIHSIFMGSDFYSRPLRIFWICMMCVYIAVVVYKVWHHFYVKGHPFQIANVSQETHNTWNLYFEGKHLDYVPGQFMIVQLVRKGKVSGPHPFTISSSPTRDRLSICVKSVGDFTSTIGDTRISDRAYIDAPYGMFSFLNHDAPHLVFIAGGIGITPFVSMLRYIYDRKLERNIVLLWGNKTESDIAFREELDHMEREMSTLKIVHVLSEQNDWHGEKGWISAEKLKRYVADFEGSQFFICGPPALMTSVVHILRELKVEKSRIHSERFALR